MMQQLIIKEQQQAFKTDAYPDTIPLANNASDVTTDDDFSNEFGDVSYCKGNLNALFTMNPLKVQKRDLEALRGTKHFIKNLFEYLLCHFQDTIILRIMIWKAFGQVVEALR